MRNILFAIAIASVLLMGNACSTADGNNPGTEYMPDMYHSIAYEANLDDYYYHNTWGTRDEYYKRAEPGKPVNGTIPRGYAGTLNKKHMNGTASNSAMSIPMNGSVPYYYADTEEERTRAMAEIINNPYPITAEGLERAKPLYDIYCGICHGEKGDGNGYLVDEKNTSAAYPAQPANFLLDEFVSASNGRYYHAIMHGKNVMGGYADKLSYEERWQVIHYIRALQAKDKKLAYNEKTNTLNTVDVPQANWRNTTFTSSHTYTNGVYGHEIHTTEMMDAHGTAVHGIGHDVHGTTTHGAEGKEKKGLIKKIIEKGEEIIENHKEKRAQKKAEKAAKKAAEKGGH